MIYDCFSFFNELDILEIRLNVLDPVVDRFVLVESAWTHHGRAKPFIFEENKARFAKFADKIIHLKITETPPPPEGLSPDESRWFLENYQRNALVRGLTDAKPDDVIMVSDCDEIPDPEIVKTLPRTNAITHFNPRSYAYYLNLRDYHYLFSGVGTTALKYRRFLDPRTYANFPFTGYVSKASNTPPTMTMVRFLAPTRRHYSGWHFSYMGGAEAVLRKLSAIADGNADGNDKILLETIRRKLEETHNLFGDGYPVYAEPPALHLPQYLIENTNRYKSLLLPMTSVEFRATRRTRLLTGLREFRKIFRDHYLFPHLASIKYILLRIFYKQKGNLPCPPS